MFIHRCLNCTDKNVSAVLTNPNTKLARKLGDGTDKKEETSKSPRTKGVWKRWHGHSSGGRPSRLETHGEGEA